MGSPKRLQSVAVALALVALAACGSSDSSDSSDSKSDTESVVTEVYKADGSSTPADKAEAASIIERRLRALGVRDAHVRVRGEQLIVTGTGIGKDAIAQQGLLEFRPLIDCVAGTSTPSSDVSPKSDAVLTGVDPCVATQAGESPLPLYSLGPALLSGVAVTSAKPSFQAGGGSGWGVDVALSPRGLADFNAKVAAPNVGRRVAIVLDDVVQSAPTVNDANFVGDIRISGAGFDRRAVRQLALALRFGALPVRLQAVSRSTG